jgi:hypothetical protein
LLQQADQWIAEADKTQSSTVGEGPRWSGLTERPTILVLRSEAEAVVRFSPVFPADPFARKGRIDSGSTDEPCQSGTR